MKRIIENKEFKISEIDSAELLRDSLNFLSSSFLWSRNKSKKLYSVLIKRNRKIGIYGFNLFDGNDNICGSLIIIYQGKYRITEKSYNVLNINSLYVQPLMRGLPTIYMIRELIKKFPDEILTEFTANKKAFELLKSMGFRQIGTFNSVITLPKALMKFCFKEKKYVFDIDNDFKKNKRNDTLHKGDAKSYEFYFKKSKIEIKYINIRKNINFFNIQLQIPGISILSVSNYRIFNDFKYQIILKLMILKLSFFIKSHCFLILNDDHNLYNHLVYTKLKKLPSDIVFGSEVSYSFF